MNTKALLALTTLCIATNAHALIVFGKSNEEAQVDYSKANAAQASVVSTSNDCSAVYLGNGWFLTANHVSVALNSQIKQNGNFATVDKIDNTLNKTFGADLKLFHVGDTSALSDLQSVKLSTDIYSKNGGLHLGRRHSCSRFGIAACGSRVW